MRKVFSYFNLDSLYNIQSISLILLLLLFLFHFVFPLVSHFPCRLRRHVVRFDAVQTGTQLRPGLPARQHGGPEGGQIAWPQCHGNDQGVPEASNQSGTRLCDQESDQGTGEFRGPGWPLLGLKCNRDY